MNNDEKAHHRENLLAFVEAFDRLPSYGPDSTLWLPLLGFQVLDPDTSPFVSVVPPAGWSLRASETSSFHARLYDHKDRQRGSVFLKVHNENDVEAKLSLINRYKAWTYQIDRNGNIAASDEAELIVGGVMDYQSDKLIFTTKRVLPVPGLGEVTPDSLNMLDELREEANAWVRANYPRWEFPQFYWD